MSLQVLVSDESPIVEHCMAYALMPRNENPNNLTSRIVPRLLPLMESRARTIEKPFSCLLSPVGSLHFLKVAE